MTFDARKLKRDQAYVQEVEIFLDVCKYTQAPYTTYNLLEADSGYSSSYTGSIAITGTYTSHIATWGTGTVYLYGRTGEIMQATALGASSITIVARGLFGTTAEAILDGDSLRLAHLGEVDGSCRGYPHDCSNNDSYDATKKLRPIFSTSPSAAGALKFPGIRNIRFDDGEVDIGESIGARASLRFEISDQYHNDYFFVPYESKRTSNGTLFGKLLARHPYLEGRKVIYREGLRDPYSFDEPEWIERVFVIDSYKLSDEKLSVKCLDPLVLTEDKKAKMPTASPARLLADLTSGSTFNFYDAPNYYFGAMSSSVFVRIDSEVIQCTVTGATQLTVVTRGYKSIQKNHDAGATIQDCIRFNGTHGVDAIVFALQDYTTVSADYLNLTAYDDIKALIPTFVLDDAIITKPIPVVDFINELIKIGNIGLYFDPVLAEIVMVYTPVQEIEAIEINERDHIKRGSVSINDNTGNQFSRFSVLWGLTDITSDSEEKYAIRYLSINAGLEGDDAMGQVNERKPQKLPLLTNSVDDSLLGAAYSSRIITENETKPKIVDITLDASQVGVTQGGELKKGSIVSLSTKYNQDKDGNNLAELFQVRKITGDAYDSYKVRMKKFNFQVAETIDFTISTGGINYDLSDYYAPPAGEYTIYIEPGVEFGSYDTSLPAFTTGAQAVGVSFRIINAGKILGMGGIGGDAGLIGSPDSEPGEDGGDAMHVTVPVTLKNSAGLIWAGGAGGSSMNYVPITPGGPIPRSGGSGGQGYGTALGGFNSDGVSHTTRAPSGNQSSAGIGAIAGGAWGEDTINLYGFSDSFGGIAIKTNGNTVTILDGNNELNIRGRIE